MVERVPSEVDDNMPPIPKKLEKKVIEEKKHEEDNLLNRDSIEQKIEHKLEHIREKIFHEEDDILFDEDEVTHHDSHVRIRGNKIISTNLPDDLKAGADYYYGYEFPLIEEIVAETLYRWIKWLGFGGNK